ncbi:MAG: recombinase RecT, partial [Planctomycetota bacterium JB042]
MSKTALQTNQRSAAIVLRDFLAARRDAIAKVMGKTLTPDRAFSLITGEFSRNAALQRCTPESIYSALHGAASLGLELSGPMQHAYPVPYANQCQLIIGYRGLAYLARACGVVKMIRAHVVHENDEFDFDPLFTDRTKFRPAKKDRGEPIGAISVAILEDGTRDVFFVDAEEIALAREASRAKNGDLWNKWWKSAWRKTAVRRHVWQLPLPPGSALIDAMSKDAEHADEMGLRDVDATVTDSAPIGDDAPPAESKAQSGAVAAAASLFGDDAPAPAEEAPDEPEVRRTREEVFEIIAKAAASGDDGVEAAIVDALGEAGVKTVESLTDDAADALASAIE